MVSLARQVRFPSSYACILFFCFAAACAVKDKSGGYYEIPKVYIKVGEGVFETTGGISYYNDKPFSGWYYGLYPSGDTAFIKGYYKGKTEGRAIRWYENKNMEEIRWYHDGRKTGKHEGWFKNGSKKFEAGLKDDCYHGNVKEWFENGLLFRDFNYTDGQESGMQKMYWDNGKIRANYQVINGRKYGLTGVKNCVTVGVDNNVHY